eukprot:1779176-Pleurochrysis_carterae.AAC.2
MRERVRAGGGNGGRGELRAENDERIGVREGHQGDKSERKERKQRNGSKGGRWEQRAGSVK